MGMEKEWQLPRPLLFSNYRVSEIDPRELTFRPAKGRMGPRKAMDVLLTAEEGETGDNKWQ